MRGVLVEVPEGMIAERVRLSLDGRDETWVGGVHTVPPASGRHQRFGSELLLVLGPLAEALGLVGSCGTGLFRTAEDYRVPDQLYCRQQAQSDRGAQGAELVVEIRSPGDETSAKLDVYAAVGVREVLVVHPDDRSVELYRRAGEQMLLVTTDASGAVRCEVLGLQLGPDGDRLRLRWDGGSAEL